MYWKGGSEPAGRLPGAAQSTRTLQWSNCPLVATEHGCGNVISPGDNIPLGGTLVVFKLGGTAVHVLPAVTNGAPLPVSLPSTMGYKQINKFEWVNASAHHVILQVVAAQTGANNGFNFDGYFNGGATFTVPVHWNVDLEYKNLAALPHSVAIADSQKAPASLETFGFAPVASANPTVGTVSRTWQLLAFDADHVGHYFMDCLVPGHLQSGMWDNFIVSPTATAPSLTTSGT